MGWKRLLPLIAVLASPLQAVFTDDAFHVDYHQALLGIPQPHTTFFHKPQSSSNASLIYTISDKAVLGAINPRDGSLVWRQALAGQPVENAVGTFLAAGDADGRITSGLQSRISSWDALSGRLNWVHDFDSGLSIRGLRAVAPVGEGAEDVIAVAGSTSAATVVRIASDAGTVRWSYQDNSANSDTSFSLATTPKHVYCITKSSGLLSGSKAKVVVIDIETGKEVSQSSVAIDSEFVSSDGSLVLGSGSESPFLLSSEAPYKTLKFNLLGSSKVSSVNLEDKGEEVQRLTVHSPEGHGHASHFLVHVTGRSRQWAEVFHVNKNGDVTKAYSLPATAETSTFAAAAVGPAVYFTRITETEVALYSSDSHGHIGRWPRSARSDKEASQSSHAAVEVSTRGVGGNALRVALSSNVGMSLIRNGEQSWSRPEALAYITKAVWSDDVQTISLAQEINTEASSNPVTAYVRRLTRHLSDLAYLPQYLMSVPESILGSGDDLGKSTRDRLIGSKLVLATTSRGEAMALDATSVGGVRWSTMLSPEGTPSSAVVHLHVDEDRLTTYLENGEVVVLNIAGGQIVDRQKSSRPFHKVVELPGQAASTIVKVSADGKPEIFSEFAPATPVEGNVLVTINAKGEAVGWAVGSSVEQIWTIQPENSARVIDVISRPSHDPVASIGQVLGDRSVLYKFISPNVALLTAISSTALTVYIINAVTGTILHTATHPGVVADLPVSAVAFGNKFAYSFTSRDIVNSGLSSQLIVAELYESAVPDNRGLLQAQMNYSSYSPDAGAKPYVVSTAFTVAEPLSELAVSQTTQGITSRQVFAYLMDSQSVVGIPGDALNARRPIDRDATANEMEEGLFRYSPIMELDPKFFLSHSREVLGIKEIMTAPTLLESTSLVFAFGHDMFGTQVAPSNTFDVLGKGFKRIQLILTVVALYAGVLALRPIARSKMVERNWL